MLARFSVSTFSIPAQAVYSQPSDSTPASSTGMVNSSSHSSGRVVGKISCTSWTKEQDRSAKAINRTADMNVQEKSDCAVLPVNRPNNEGTSVPSYKPR
jgi:hypothetical protein